MNDGTLLFVNFAVYSWLLLVPVIAVEARELKRGLPATSGRAAAVCGVANLFSTVLTTAFVFAAGWLLGHMDVIAQPQAGEGDIAVLAALVPCFFLSVWAETLVARPLLKPFPAERIRSMMLRANLLGYAMIAVVPVARFVKSFVINGRIIW